MKLKMLEIQTAYNNLQRLSQSGKTFPMAVSYAVMKNLKKLESEATIINAEVKKVCEKYADQDENGNAKTETSTTEDGREIVKYIFSDGKEVLANQELKEFQLTETEVDIHMIKQSDLEKCEENDRYDVPSINELMIFDFMVESENG